MKFQQIRSATAIITYGGVRFLIDPWLSAKDAYPPIPGSPHPELRCPIHELPMPVEKIMEVDAVIATHLHFDHFDETAIRILPKTLPVFVQDEVDAATLLGYGFQDVRILKFGGVKFNGVQLFKTGCHHGIPGRAENVYEAINIRGEACGAVFRHPEERTLYLAGDTIWCDYVAEAIRQHQPDVIVVNAAEATIEACGRIIMGLDDVREVLRAAPDAVVIASHMDNVGHEMLWREDIHKFVKENSLELRVLVPEDGEVCEF